MKTSPVRRQAQAGFTLIELMIVVAIIGILAALALPAYTQYVDKTKFSEIILASHSAKSAVDICVQDKGTPTGCSGSPGNQAGIPVNVMGAPDHYVESVTTTDGVITVVPKPTGKITSADTYILRAVLDSNTKVQWRVDPASGCIAARLCKG